MQRLEALAEKVISAHGSNHPELLGIRNRLEQMFAELRGHMFKEEQILFPFIVELEQSVSQQRPAPFAPFGTVKLTFLGQYTRFENFAAPSRF
jgi:regulator of cell morphogenesis and NO signaling